MAGHSKWANIKHRKGKSDAQKGKMFTKLGREIAVCVKRGGPDPEVNGKLKDIIAKAKRSNMPNESIERSVKKAAGDTDMKDYEEIIYEGYGPGGVAFIVEAMTDNRNRTAGEVRHYFDKFGGNLGTTGCVAFLFQKKGQIIIEKKDGLQEEKLMMDALESGAEDFSVEEEFYEILVSTENLQKTTEDLEEKRYQLDSAELTMIPAMYTKLTEEKQEERIQKLIDALEDNEDVQNVFHNWQEE
jgi:YebC/PmpR family DNA-binding regulatory protein